MKKIATLSLIVRLAVGCGDSSASNPQLPAFTQEQQQGEESTDENKTKEEEIVKDSPAQQPVAKKSSEVESSPRTASNVDSLPSEPVATVRDSALMLTASECTSAIAQAQDAQVKSGVEFVRCDGSRGTGTLEPTVTTTTVVVAPSPAPVYQECTGNGQTGCLTNATYKSANLTNAVASNIRTGVNVAGVDGSFNPSVESHSDCTSNGQVGCVTTSTFRAADLTNLTPANIKANVTIAGTQGQYPSATYPLSGAISNVADLDTATFNAKIKADAGFEWFDSAGARHSASGSSLLTAENVRSTVSFFGFSGTLNPGATPNAWDLREGYELNGVTGLAKMTCQDANPDTSLNCSSSSWMQLANIGSYAVFKDRITNLRWAKVASGPVNYTSVVNVCATLDGLDGEGWRLPSASEVRQALIHKMLSYSPTANYWLTSGNVRTWTSTYSSNSSYANSIATGYAETAILKTDTTTIGFCVK